MSPVCLTTWMSAAGFGSHRQVFSYCVHSIYLISLHIFNVFSSVVWKICWKQRQQMTLGNNYCFRRKAIHWDMEATVTEVLLRLTGNTLPHYSSSSHQSAKTRRSQLIIQYLHARKRTPSDQRPKPPPNPKATGSDLLLVLHFRLHCSASSGRWWRPVSPGYPLPSQDAGSAPSGHWWLQSHDLSVTRLLQKSHEVWFRQIPFAEGFTTSKKTWWAQTSLTEDGCRLQLTTGQMQPWVRALFQP